MYTYVAAAVMTPITAITYVSESARRDILEVYSTVSIILLLTSELKRSLFFGELTQVGQKSVEENMKRLNYSLRNLPTLINSSFLNEESFFIGI